MIRQGQWLTGKSGLFAYREVDNVKNRKEHLGHVIICVHDRVKAQPIPDQYTLSRFLLHVSCRHFNKGTVPRLYSINTLGSASSMSLKSSYRRNQRDKSEPYKAGSMRCVSHLRYMCVQRRAGTDQQ